MLNQQANRTPEKWSLGLTKRVEVLQMMPGTMHEEDMQEADLPQLVTLAAAEPLPSAFFQMAL